MKLKNIELAEVEDIVFDFGNVLLDIDIKRSIDAFATLGVDKIDPHSVHPNNSGVFLQLEVGSVTAEQFCDQIRSYASQGAQITDKQILKAWNELLLPYDYSRFELIRQLRKSGYRVHLLSNTNKPHHDHFEAVFNRENPFGFTFKEIFDGIYYSDELKIRKPEAEIYETVAEMAGLEGRKTLFVDDNAPNLVAPKELGWHVYHLVKPETVFDLFQ